MFFQTQQQSTASCFLGACVRTDCIQVGELRTPPKKFHGSKSPFSFYRSLLTLSFLVAVNFLAPSVAWSITAQEEQLVKMVIDAIDRNNSLIKSAQLTVREIRIDAGVEELEVQKIQQPDGGELQILRSPKVEWESHIVLRGGDLRVDRSVAGNNTTLAPNETLVLSKGVWSQYFPDGSIAWIRKHKDMPRMFPVDPREAASDGAHRNVIEVLREDRIISATSTVTTDDNPLVRIKLSNADGIPAVYEFSAKDLFLPSRVETRWPDGSLLQVVKVTYQDVLEGKAKFLQRSVRTFFTKGKRHTSSHEGWRQQLSCEVIGKVVLNESLPDDVFAVEFAPGTRVNDNIRLANYFVSSPLKVGPHPMWPYTLVAVIVLLILTVTRRFKIDPRIST